MRSTKLAVALGTAVFLILLAAGTVSAWTYLGTFSGAQYWSPNYGEMYAQFADDGYRSRYLDADAENFYYDSYRIGTMGVLYKTSIVYHAFRRDTNCFVNMTGTGYYWTNYPYPSLEMKTANCSGENYSGNNELRIWNTVPGSLQANVTYYAGAEYKDRSFEAGGGRLDGEMNYDAYSCLTCEEHMSKFYYNTSNQFQ
ncbi:MAG: hypothetical protein M1570_16515 [Chloroflexi bacterium]|nr:hypothetical protein [Chloroflexota bacterium]